MIRKLCHSPCCADCVMPAHPWVKVLACRLDRLCSVSIVKLVGHLCMSHCEVVKQRKGLGFGSTWMKRGDDDGDGTGGGDGDETRQARTVMRQEVLTQEEQYQCHPSRCS
jgi:hypothetical protein